MIKKVGKTYYVHKSNKVELVSRLNRKQQQILNRVIALNIINKETAKNYSNYAIIKYNTENDNVSLIECFEWDTPHEPTVGDSYCYKTDGTMRIVPGGSKVYHNKWQFVGTGYTGFNLEESQKRSSLWQKEIKGIKDIKHLIGNKEYWHKLLKENNIEI